jgi:MFS family permease
MAISISPAHASYLDPFYGHAAHLDGVLPRILSKPAAVRAKPADGDPAWRFIATVLLPFAAGYYLSYVFRTINALISGPLATEFGLSAADLGLLTAVLFLTFGAVQLPLGAWLDRFGPRRVQAVLLSIAAIGATIFACAPSLLWLILGRALIGLGVAGALMGGLKAIVLWWPAERVAIANGWLITLGALGAVTATAPAEMLIASIGWRGLFLLLAALAAIAAVLIQRFVPERPARGLDEAIGADTTIRTIYRDARFWRLAPLSATTIGSAWALQGLWAAPWLADVEGLARHDVVMHLLWMAIVLCASALVLGAAGDRLRRRSISLSTIFAFASGFAFLAQLSLVLRLPIPAWLPWMVVAGVGAGTVLSFAIVSQLFPKSASGRASAALNLLHISAAFAVQLGTGFVLDLWPIEAGRHPPMAYQTALGISLALQATAFLWFVRPNRRGVLAKKLSAHPTHELATSLGVPVADAFRYLQARRDWRLRQMIACRQVSAWRSVALVAVAIIATMGATLAMSLPTSLALPQLPQSQVEPGGEWQRGHKQSLAEHVGMTVTSPSRFNPLSRQLVCIASITVLFANGRTYLPAPLACEGPLSIPAPAYRGAPSGNEVENQSFSESIETL